MNNTTASFYNQISFLYPLIDIFLRPQKRVLCREINVLPPGKLLEVGVGDGSHLHWYKKHGVTGIDTSSKMLELAKKKNTDAELIQMNGQALLFPDQSFDYIVLSHVIAVADDPEQMLKEVYRVLNPGGKVIILNHFTPDNQLKHIDQLFSIISKKFHFRSVFYIDELTGIKKFTLLKEVSFMQSYFKLLIYQKK